MANIIKVKTPEELFDLYTNWAMTWEGLIEEDFETALEMCCKDGKDGTGYVITGKDFNRLCGLTGSNAYPNDLTIFCIKDFKGLAMQFGARWMTDIIDNNAIREKCHPFRA